MNAVQLQKPPGEYVPQTEDAFELQTWADFELVANLAGFYWAQPYNEAGKVGNYFCCFWQGAPWHYFAPQMP